MHILKYFDRFFFLSVVSAAILCYSSRHILANLYFRWFWAHSFSCLLLLLCSPFWIKTLHHFYISFWFTEILVESYISDILFAVKLRLCGCSIKNLIDFYFCFVFFLPFVHSKLNVLMILRKKKLLYPTQILLWWIKWSELEASSSHEKQFMQNKNKNKKCFELHRMSSKYIYIFIE